jgi:hypothetical protein
MSLHPAGAFATVESVVPERKRINEDNEGQDDEGQVRTETWHSFQSL